MQGQASVLLRDPFGQRNFSPGKLVWDCSLDGFLDATPSPRVGSSRVGSTCTRGAARAAKARVERALAAGQEDCDRRLVVDVGRRGAADGACVVVAFEDDLSRLAPSWICVDLARWLVAASGAFGSLAGGAAAPGCGDEVSAAADP